MAQIDVFFKELIERNGSDLHLEQGQKPKMRIHGKLISCDDHPVLTQEYLCEILREICSQDNCVIFERI